MLVTEHDSTQHDLFRQPVGFGFDHQHSILGAGDDEFELGIFERREAGIEDIFAVNVADLGRTDRAGERHARNRERSRGADHRRDIGIDVRVERHDGRNDLHFVGEALREQRSNGAIDESAGQDLLLARAPFALEETARDLARGIGFFLVVDGQREEVTTRIRGFLADCRDKHGGLGHVDDNGTVCLASYCARINGYLVFPVLETLSD